MNSVFNILTAERSRRDAEVLCERQEELRHTQEASRAVAEETRVVTEADRLSAAKEVSATVRTLTELLERMEAVETIRRRLVHAGDRASGFQS